MAFTFTALPEDVLVLIFLRLLVEDVLVLMQTCRVMHALGSLDYLWRALLSRWDIPLDIPPNASIASLPSDVLRLAAVKSLRLDNRWRNPHLEMHHAQRIISQNSSFVDGMRFLPGGRWLVTLQYEQTSKTHITLWFIAGLDHHHSIFKATVLGRVRFLHAHHHHELEQITIGIAFARGTSEFIRVYDILLQEDSLNRHSLIFEATPAELNPMGRIAGIKINGEIMIAVFAPLSSSKLDGQIVCINLVSRATVIFECPGWSFAWFHLKVFRRYFAVTSSVYTPRRTATHVAFYELPPAILGHSDYLPQSVSRWPEKLTIERSMVASTYWSLDKPLALELSDDVPINNAGICTFSIFGYPMPTQRLDVQSPGVDVLHVSFNGRDIERVLDVVACRCIPSAREIRVSPSGKRAVWLNMDPDTQECTLMKFALGRKAGSGSETCVSTLMPSFSGLPFNPRDFHSFAFDELSCRMAVGLPSGELYILHY